MNKEVNNQSDHKYYVLGLKMMIDIGAVLTIPAIVAAILGKYLDGLINKGPIFITILLVCAFISSLLIVYRKAGKYRKEYLDL